MRLLARAMAVLLASAAVGAAAEVPVESPEGQARKAAEVAAKKGLRVRQDAWRGVVNGEKGRAVRMQLFRGHTYEFYFAAGAAEKAKGTKMHVGVMAGGNVLVAKGGGEGHVAKVVFKPEATGAYLILLRSELTSGDAKREVPCALVVGYR